jgi:isocitrate dehydrogenase
MLADQPERFDVIVTLNLYGDIISDVAAQITGSVGLGGSANIGENIAMFEAVHGSAPDIAGQNKANPSGLLLGAVQMLTHIGDAPAANAVYNAWAATLEDGLHTGDIYRAGKSKALVGTTQFADAVIARLGQKPKTLAPAKFEAAPPRQPAAAASSVKRWVHPPQTKVLHGVDIFLNWKGAGGADELAAKLQAATKAAPGGLTLQLITNRGVRVWPGGFPETFCTDHWRCRFRPAGAAKEGGAVDYGAILALQTACHGAGLDVIKTENLCFWRNADGSSVAGFSLGQGE